MPIRAEPSWTFVGLGGNLGGESVMRARLRQAVDALEGLAYVHSLVSSSVYRTGAMGPVPDQPMFFNMVVAFAPHDREPQTLLRDLQAIESRLGRVRPVAIEKGPRAIDLDLLLIGGLELSLPGPPALTLPHPAMTERRFVLEPLLEIAGPGLEIPGVGAEVGALLRGCRRQLVTRL